MSTIRAGIVTFALAAFAATGLTAATPAAEAKMIDTSECLKVMRRDGNYLVCGDKVYKVKSRIPSR